MVEHAVSMCKTLGSIHNPTKQMQLNYEAEPKARFSHTSWKAMHTRDWTRWTQSVTFAGPFLFFSNARDEARTQHTLGQRRAAPPAHPCTIFTIKKS
jgi:hypothetical protein